MRNLTVGVWLLALCSLSSLTLADTPADVQRVLQTAYNNRNLAVSQTNLYGVLAYYSPDFTYLSPEGKTMDKEQSKAALTPLFEQVIAVRMTTHILKISLQNEEATVKAKHWIVETLPEEPVVLAGQPISQETSRYVDVSTDTWTHQSGKWLLKSCHTLTRVEVNPDGSIITHPDYRDDPMRIASPHLLFRLIR